MTSAQRSARPATRRHHRRHHRVAVALAVAVLANLTAPITPIGATPARAPLPTDTPATLDCDPIACAAAYIGVPMTTLSAGIVNETRSTGTIGIQSALDQLNAALSKRLTAISPTMQPSLAMSYAVEIATHDAIRNAFINQTVAAICGSCGG